MCRLTQMLAGRLVYDTKGAVYSVSFSCAASMRLPFLCPKEFAAQHRALTYLTALKRHGSSNVACSRPDPTSPIRTTRSMMPHEFLPCCQHSRQAVRKSQIAAACRGQHVCTILCKDSCLNYFVLWGSCYGAVPYHQQIEIDHMV